MQNAEHAQKKSVTNKVHELQQTLDAKGYSSLGMGIAGIVIGLTFCPLSILAVACPYWTASTDAVSSSMSLWTASVTVNMGGSSIDNSMDMCGDEMNDSGECGKIDALRFFTITKTLLLCASCVLIITGFSPALKSKAALRIQVSAVGAVLTGVALLWVFLSICIAASVDIPATNLNGAGFVSLVLELFAIIPAIVLLVFALRHGKSTSAAAGVVQQAPKNAQSGPNLLEGNKVVVKSQVAPRTRAAESEDAKVEDVENGLAGMGDTITSAADEPQHQISTSQSK